MNTQIDREALRREGWQVIETKEEKRRFSPLQTNDEALMHGFSTQGGTSWCRLITLGYAKFEPGVIYRRRIYRRRISAPVEPAAAPASGWVSTKDRLPTEADLPVILWNSGVPKAKWTATKDALRSQLMLTCFSHWMRAPFAPPLPEPVKPTQEELDEAAAKEWVAGRIRTYGRTSDEMHDAYLAGLRAERARGGKGTV